MAESPVPSPYVVTVPTTRRAQVIANLASGEVLLADNNEAAAFLKGHDPDGDLTKGRFLVCDIEREKARVIERHREAARKPAVFNLTILPTLACNFTCAYCFEGKRPRSKHALMTPAVADAIVALAEREAPRHLRMELAWFGGEPLLAMDLILSMTRRLHVAAERAACEFAANITTNGYCLNGRTVDKLERVGVRSIQVTLDGDRQTHDAARRTVTGKGSFDRILANILNALERASDVQFIVRANLSRGQANRIIVGLESVPEYFRSRIAVHIHRVMKGNQPEGFEEDFATEIAQTYQALRAAGFSAAVDAYLDPTPGVYCYAERTTGAVIDPKGNVYRCAYTNYDGRERIGTLESDGTIRPTGRYLDIWEGLVGCEPTRCLDCKFLPICGFGCPKLRMSNDSTMTCQNRFNFLPDTLRALAAAAE